MRFAFRCPKVWDLPAVEGLLWCDTCGRHVHDLTVLPDLDPQAWIEAHPGACVRALADREGNLLRKIPRRALVSSSAIAVFSDPCAPAVHAPADERTDDFCEDEPQISIEAPEESDNPWVPPREPEPVHPAEEISVAEGYVTAGYIVEPAIAAAPLEPAPLPVIAIYDEPPPVIEPPERRKRGLFGGKRRR